MKKVYVKIRVIHLDCVTSESGWIIEHENLAPKPTEEMHNTKEPTYSPPISSNCLDESPIHNTDFDG